MVKKLLLIGILAALPTAYAACLSTGEAIPEASTALTVKLSTIDVSQDEDRRSVSSLGTIKNTSDSCFDDVVVEVKYFDSSHALTDTIVQPIYGLVIPSNDVVAIRVLDAAVKPKEAYVSQEARVLSAEPRVSREKLKATLWSTLGELAISWGPMFLLIAVWIYFMQRMRRKDSPQERSIALLQQQVELSTAQSQALNRVAAALESLASTRRDS